MMQISENLDEQTLYKELKLPDLRRLAEAHSRMTYSSADVLERTYDTEKGVLEIFFPGPVVKYEQVSGQYHVQIYHNGGNKRQSEQFFDYLITYANRSSGQ